MGFPWNLGLSLWVLYLEAIYPRYITLLRLSYSFYAGSSFINCRLHILYSSYPHRENPPSFALKCTDSKKREHSIRSCLETQISSIQNHISPIAE